jgi:hypothetical protein
MNSKLKEVMEAVSRLPEKDQEELAAVILQEIEDEAKWDRTFEGSQPQLKRLAENALEEYRAGGTEPLDPTAL